MAPSCPFTNGASFRGPPAPLLLVPIAIQLVRAARDPKMSAFLQKCAEGGPKAIADNAHYLAQYALSRVPANVLYWFTARVLNLPSEIALQTTEFIKSRGDLETIGLLEGFEEKTMKTMDGTESGAMSMRTLDGVADIEKRLERLELDYQLLQNRHAESLQLLQKHTTDSSSFQRELPLPDVVTVSRENNINSESMQLMRVDATQAVAQSPPDAGVLVQDVGLRLGRIFLEWAGDTLKQMLITAAAKSSGNQAVVGAGVDLAGRLVDAIIT